MQRNQLIKELHQIGAIKFGTFTLKSGQESPIYVDLRLTISYPSLLRAISQMMWELVGKKQFDLITGVPYTALPFATAISLKQEIPMILKRKEIKEYGTKKAIEGEYQAGQNCLVIEDLITSGSSLFETIEPLQKEGILVQDAVVLIDREQGGKRAIESRGIKLHAVLTLTEILKGLHEAEILTSDIVTRVKHFIQTHQVGVK